MLTVADALKLIDDFAAPLPPRELDLADSAGTTLAREILAPLDSPPFTKALMDGYAVLASDVANGTAELNVVEEVTAGNVAQHSVTAGTAIRIMTGAPMPNGANAVVRVEDTDFSSETNCVTINTSPVQPGQSVMQRGAATRAGDVVIPAGQLIRPQEIGALAEMGFARVTVFPQPDIAVLATGDELVPVGQEPGPGQIRNSNEAMLVAQIVRAGGKPHPLGIARDNRDDLSAKIRQGLDCDILLLSGGVSAGKLDLVPSELQAAGVEQIFHKVAVKPGKPVWFGIRRAASESGHQTTLVFGLPGNPVSSMVCFELFVRAAIRRCAARKSAAKHLKASLSADHIARGDRPTYHPSQLSFATGSAEVTPVAWQGSADLSATVKANSMVLFPAGGSYPAGAMVEVIPWQAD